MGANPCLPAKLFRQTHTAAERHLEVNTVWAHHFAAKDLKSCAREDRFVLGVLRQAGLTRAQLARIERANLERG